MDFNTCSFCGKKSEREESFIRGKTGCICFDCARQLAIFTKREEMLHRKSNHQAPFDIDWKEITPSKLKAYMDEFVIGQEEAKEVLSVAFYNHYKRFSLEKRQEKKYDDGIEIEKSNIVLIGQTGVGKTYLLKTIARKLKVPFCVVDATSFTQVGYVGEDPETMLARLLQISGFDIAATEWGIVFIDEIDKIATFKDNASGTHDIGKGVQQAILKIVEGSIVSVAPEGGRRHPDQRTVNVNTKNILFICGGAFEGIHNIIKKRLAVVPIGFQRKIASYHKIKDEELIKYVSSEDLKRYGILPELVGRFPVIVHLNALTEEMIKKILTEPKNAILKQYKKLFAMEDIALNFTPGALDAIVRNVLKQNLGARSLRSTLEKVLKDAMFNLPNTRTRGVNAYIIDEAYVHSKLKTEIHKLKQQEENTDNSSGSNFIVQVNTPHTPM